MNGTDPVPESPAIEGGKCEAISIEYSRWTRLRWKWDDLKYRAKERLQRLLLNMAFALSGQSNYVEHAKREMKAAGLYDEDSDYGGMLPEAVLDLLHVHSMQGHSGASNSLTISLFSKLAQFKALTPLTDNPEEWMECGLKYGDKDECWQNIRMSSCFSLDGGKTYYNLDDPEYVKFDIVKDEVTGEEYKSYYQSYPPVSERKMHTSVPHKKVEVAL